MKIRIKEAKTNKQETKLTLRSILEQSITENENENEKADDAMGAGLSALKSGLSGLKGYEAPEPKKEDKINEGPVAFIASGLLAAPKLLEWLGKAVNFIAKKMSKNKDIASGKGISEFGKKWEGLYIRIITEAIKLTGFIESQWKDKNGKIDEEKLKLVAKVLYAVILGVALTAAVKGVISPGSAIMKSLEAVFGTTKAVEIASIAKAVASKMGVNMG
jgi:hypothetical protein